MFKKKLFVAALIASTAPAAFAADVGGMYILGSIGQSKVVFDKASIDSELTAVGVTGLASTTDETDTGYKLQLGYQVNQTFSVEGGYVDLGKFSYSATFTGGTASESIEATGWNIAAVGTFPLNDAFSVLGKIGLIRAKVEATAQATGPGGTALANASSTDWKATYGIGVAYNVSKSMSVRAEFERFSKLGDNNTTGEGDVDLFSVGLGFRF